MVLQVLSHSGPVAHDIDIKRTQTLAPAYSGKLKELWTCYRARGENDLS
jgi:hypothetical protein